MVRNRLFAAVAAVLLLAALPAAVSAAEVDCDSIYCFVPEDFSGEPLSGICITSLPESRVGTMMLGSRVLRPGDILTGEQVSQMTFCPLRTQTDQTAQVGYLAIYPDHVAEDAAMEIAVWGKEDKAPVAEDLALETYKNLPNQGKLKAKDPEGQGLTYTLIRQPKRGEVSIAEDGSFTYTPKKNKVGVDSFVFTASDPAGNVSREATVTIRILKPTEATQYTDTIGKNCRFAAEWMKNTGIFVGENLAGNACFSPEREVTQGEFLSMLVKTLDIPAQTVSATEYVAQAPLWLQPYLTAAVRSGLTAGLPDQQVFSPDSVITGAEAAVMVYNALDLAASQTMAAQQDTAPDWAKAALSSLAEAGMVLEPGSALTRGQAAQLLYSCAQLEQQETLL